jgi:cell division protein FtsW (lipid II flippase)
MSRRETWVTALAVVMPTMGHRFQATNNKVGSMFMWVLIGGLFTLLALSLLNVGSLISNVFAMVLGLLTLMVMFQIAAAVFKGIVRRWIGVPQQGNSVRMSNSRTVP